MAISPSHKVATYVYAVIARLLRTLTWAAILCACSYLIYPVAFMAWQSQPNTLQEGFTTISDITGQARGLADIKAELNRRQIAYSEVSPAACQQFHLQPQFECRGGAALFITLNPKAVTLNPWYVPSLNTFMAFDAQQQFSYATTRFMGGD